MFKVIIVDDEDIFRRNLINKIQWGDLNCSLAGQASNGIEALSLIESSSPDIILCDIKMPLMDGLEVLMSLKKNLNIKFIILSGFNDFEFTRTAIKYGAFDYILKPIKQEELTGVLLRAIEDLESTSMAVSHNMSLSIQIREQLLKKYESLLIHFVESKDLTNIYKYIDEFYSELGTVSTPEVYMNTFKEFVFLASKICDIFMLDKNFINDNFSSSALIYKTPQQRDAIIYCVKSIFKRIIEELICQNNSDGKRIVNDIMSYVEKHYNTKITLESISRQYHINPSYFSQIFKKVTSVTFSAYLINIRINRAKDLLSNTDLKIYQVSEMVGYEDEKHFSQLFKKYTGQSPTVWVNNKQQDL